MKCVWCDKKLDYEEIDKNIYYRELEWNESLRFCSHECKEKFENFLGDIEKNKNKFLSILVSWIILYVITMIFLSRFENVGTIATCIFWVLFGGMLIRYPYGTSETNKLIGIQKTIKFIRGIGIIFVVSSLFILVFNFL